MVKSEIEGNCLFFEGLFKVALHHLRIRLATAN